MADNPKNRGRSHRFNKAKYNKNKPQPILPNSNSKPKSLVPNWDRYEEEVTSINDYEPVGSDFSRLANAPISKGSHFQFKSDSIRIEDVEKNSSNTCELFNIDLNLTGLSLSTIAFNERCGIPDDYFSVSQRKIMSRTAKNNENLYEQSLKLTAVKNKSYYLNIDSYLPRNDSSEKSETNITLKNKENSQIEDISQSDYVEEESSKKSVSKQVLVNKECSNYGIEKGPSLESPSSILEMEELSQWLDDVLGD